MKVLSDDLKTAVGALALPQRELRRIESGLPAPEARPHDESEGAFFIEKMRKTN